MWYRVFCRSDDRGQTRRTSRPRPAAGPAGDGQFRGDDLGWTAAEFSWARDAGLRRALPDREDDLRDDLNTWAAWLETQDHEPNHARLMEHVIQSKQLVTVRKPLDHPNESAVEDLCRTVCRAVAEAADGVYQVEGDGWYAADGHEAAEGILMSTAEKYLNPR